jgi:hypothetical protein
MTMITNMFMQFAPDASNRWSTIKAQLKTAEQDHRVFIVRLPIPVPISEIMKPKFWIGCRDLKQGEIVRVVVPNAAGGRPFDFNLVVLQNVGANGAVMAPWPYVPPGLMEAQPQPLRTEEKPSSAPQIEHARV